MLIVLALATLLQTSGGTLVPVEPMAGQHLSEHPLCLHGLEQQLADQGPRAGGGADGVSGVIGGKLYVLTGAAAGALVKRLDRYDPVTNTWTSRAAPTGFHADAAAGVINGKRYVAGGATPSGFSNAVEAYDPATNGWTALTPMPTARSAAMGVVVNGRLYVVGGQNASLNTMATVEVYTPGTDSWRTVSPMISARSLVTGGDHQGPALRGRRHRWRKREPGVYALIAHPKRRA